MTTHVRGVRKNVKMEHATQMSVCFTNLGVGRRAACDEAQLLLFIPTGSLKRGHPDPGFIQPGCMVSAGSIQDEGETHRNSSRTSSRKSMRFSATK